MSYTKHIGIDPGKSGAAACVTISDGSIDDVDWLCFNHRDTSAKQILKMFQNNYIGIVISLKNDLVTNVPHKVTRPVPLQIKLNPTMNLLKGKFED